MKKFMLFGIFLFGLLVSSISFATVDSDFEVAVVTVYGDVTVDETGAGKFVPATEGMKLKPGAVLKTGAKSLSDIVFDFEGLNVVNVKEDSKVVVRSESVDLPEGAVLVKFDNLKKGQTFSVKTPTTTCGIRGSGMGVRHILGITHVRAFRHSVFIQGLGPNGRPKGPQHELLEGTQGDVDENGNLGEQLELTGDDNEEWREFSGVEDASEEENGDLANFEDEQRTEDGEIDPKDIVEKKEISPSR